MPQAFQLVEGDLKTYLKYWKSHYQESISSESDEENEEENEEEEEEEEEIDEKLLQAKANEFYKKALPRMLNVLMQKK